LLLGTRLFALVGISVTSVFGASPTEAAGMQVPTWLTSHVGEGDGQIAQIVLERARALYLAKVSEGKVKNACYFAMDATRPNHLAGEKSGGRFYTICEAEQIFRVASSGHGSGRKLTGVVDFSNGRQCAKNFGNAQDSNLTAGGAYLTSEIKTSFKGYYKNASGQQSPLTRSFVQFDGAGDTANARQRAIGGHPASLISGVCMLKKPGSPYANSDGYVPFGKLVNYEGGRSNGCTTWSPFDAPQILSTVKDNPTTVYIYPEARDIAAVSKTLAAGKSLNGSGTYWNASCLTAIGTPRFWSKEELEPRISQYKLDNPAPPKKATPICAANIN